MPWTLVCNGDVRRCGCAKPKPVEVIDETLEGERVVSSSRFYLCDRCGGGIR